MVTQLRLGASSRSIRSDLEYRSTTRTFVPVMCRLVVPSCERSRARQAASPRSRRSESNRVARCAAATDGLSVSSRGQRSHTRAGVHVDLAGLTRVAFALARRGVRRQLRTATNKRGKHHGGTSDREHLTSDDWTSPLTGIRLDGLTHCIGMQARSMNIEFPRHAHHCSGTPGNARHWPMSHIPLLRIGRGAGPAAACTPRLCNCNAARGRLQTSVTITTRRDGPLASGHLLGEFRCILESHGVLNGSVSPQVPGSSPGREPCGDGPLQGSASSPPLSGGVANPLQQVTCRSAS